MNKIKKNIVFLLVFLNLAIASTGPRIEVLEKKTGHYRSDGFFVGGKKEVTTAQLTDIRRANNNDFERVVFDLDLEEKDFPFFQIQNAEGESRIIVSFWANVQYAFNSEKIKKNFEKSKNIKKVNIIPRLEDGLTIIELQLKNKISPKLDVFVLKNPNRLIIDLK
jgi:hypothetical protein